MVFALLLVFSGLLASEVCKRGDQGRRSQRGSKMDSKENKDNVIFIPTSSTVETLKSKRIHRWPCVGPEDKEVILEETKE